MFTVDTLPLQPQLQTVSPASISERAESELRRNAYVALKNISCDYRDGVLTLSGCLPTYYLKQIAQETVSGLSGVDFIENRIEVVAPLRRASFDV